MLSIWCAIRRSRLLSTAGAVTPATYINKGWGCDPIFPQTKQREGGNRWTEKS